MTPEERSAFEEFCDFSGIRLVTRERQLISPGVDRWYVASEGLVEIREGGMLISPMGGGRSPVEALEDYARRIAGKRLLIGGDREVVAPREWV